MMMPPDEGSSEGLLGVAVLLDWQNIYSGAREAFDLSASSVEGQVDLIKLAHGLAGGVDQTTGQRRELAEIRLYRGRPDNAQDPRTYAAFRAQTAAWEQRRDHRFTLCARDLRYSGGHIREKGIDVWLAVDLAKLAMRPTVDRVVVFSTDTDLVPALELAVEERGPQFVEVACWDGIATAASILRVPGHRIVQRKLKRPVYDRLADATDYNLPKRRRRTSGDVWDAQIAAEGRRPRRR